MFDLTFTVRDNGIGIPSEFKEQIFGLFSRLHNADRYEGTGLGLAICQRIVERYHGRIWVESQLGQGSGLRGLPGDFTPPSRFVRAVAFSQSALPSDTAPQAVLQAFHILNNFDIPYGAVRQTENGQTVAEMTTWTSASDLKNLRWYFRTYDDQSIRSVDLPKALAAPVAVTAREVQPKKVRAADGRQAERTRGLGRGAFCLRQESTQEREKEKGFKTGTVNCSKSRTAMS